MKKGREEMKKTIVMGTLAALLIAPSLFGQVVSAEDSQAVGATPVQETAMASRSLRSASDFVIDPNGKKVTITVDPHTITTIYDEKGNKLVPAGYESGNTKMYVWFELNRKLQSNERIYAQSVSVQTGKVTDKLWATFEPAAQTDSMPIYRVYNPNNGGHLYTANQAEAMHVVSLGWNDENIAWDAPTEGQPIYRLYNPNSGEHFYTVDVAEYDAVGKAGWNQEGQVFFSDLAKQVPVYRVFNPNAKGPGSHHYTTSAGERDNLVSIGWKNEGTAFYGVTN